MTVGNLLNRLEKVRPNGTQKWMACCPAHDDKNPSLGIKENSDGTILIHCFAGCGASEVLTAVDLEMTDLFSDKTINDLKDWERFKRQQEYKKRQGEKENKQEWNDNAILVLAAGDRRNRKKLSQHELKLEREAYLRTRNANTNGH